MKIESYKQMGGIHPETATITNVLASQGMVAPHTKRPFTEAMIFGIAGGLGCGYILWEFKKYNAAILVMGFQNKWNYTAEFMQNLCERLDISTDFAETGGKKRAATDLDNALQAGQPAIAWVCQQSLPHYFMRPMYNGCFGHFVTAFGVENEHVWIDDRAKRPFQVKTAIFNQSRARIGSFKNRLLLLDASRAEFDLETAVRAGIADCVDYMGRSSQTFAIPVFKKWARLMTDTRNKKGWPVVFTKQAGLYSTLSSLHEGIKHFGTAGGGLRYFYADFLNEAATVLNNSQLKEAAEQYHALGDRWAAFADAVLPDHIAPLAETKRLLADKHAIFNEKGGTGLAKLENVCQSLNDIEKELNSQMPMSAAEMDALFHMMQDHLTAIYNAENEALASLTI